MEPLSESTLNDLYKSAVRAFPNTLMRQHATHPVKITKLEWTPYVGMKTLFVKGLAQNEQREYNTIVLFKKVNYDGDGIRLVVDGIEYSFAPLSLEGNDVLLRCNCPDFYWRFNYYNSVDKSLYATKRKKYEGTTGKKANPMELPGMCKHLMKTVKVLGEAGLFI